MFEPLTLNFDNFDGTYLHPAKDYDVQELCRIVQENGKVFAVFATEENAEECAIFFPNHLGFCSYNGYMNAIQIA